MLLKILIYPDHEIRIKKSDLQKSEVLFSKIGSNFYFDILELSKFELMRGDCVFFFEIIVIFK